MTENFWSDKKVIDFVYNHLEGIPTAYLYKMQAMLDDYKKEHTPVSVVEKRNALFVTEDGVELFGREEKLIAIDRKTGEIEKPSCGDTVGAWINGWYTQRQIPNPKEHDGNVLMLIHEKWVFFHNPIKAQEWQVIHKPIKASYKELVDFLQNGDPNGLYAMLNNFFKSKINQP